MDWLRTRLTIFSYLKVTSQNVTKGVPYLLQLAHPKTEKLKKSYSFFGAKHGNSLPKDLRNADTLSDFKKEICANKL